MLKFTDDALAIKLGSIIRLGEVSSVNAEKGTACVVFDDDDGVVSAELPVLHRNTFSNKDYAMPDVGEDVLCLFLPNGLEDGFILGSIYAGEVTPPENTIDKRTVVFSDDTRVSYDRAEHVLTVSIGDTTIEANGESVRIDAASDVTIKGSITLDGDVKVTGKVDADGDVSTSGKVTAAGDIATTGGDVVSATLVHLSTHKHPTATPGLPSSPTPGT